jgi:hypothetical protein
MGPWRVGKATSFCFRAPVRKILFLAGLPNNGGEAPGSGMIEDRDYPSPFESDKRFLQKFSTSEFRVLAYHLAYY